MGHNPRYNVTVSPVEEVALLGGADAGFWQRRLRPAGLLPILREGRAQLLVCAVAGKFFGVPFRELPIAVCVHPPQATQGEAYYLECAFSWPRCFAFVERVINKSPYRTANIELISQLPARFAVRVNEQLALQAVMADEPTGSRQPIRSGQEEFCGPIYLPSPASARTGKGRVFYARLSGPTQSYAFVPADRLCVHPIAGHPIFQDLLESDFRPWGWQIRIGATHSKSKTLAVELAQDAAESPVGVPIAEPL